MPAALLWAYSAEEIFLFRGSETPAGVSEPHFHERDCLPSKRKTAEGFPSAVFRMIGGSKMIFAKS
jgi:hypothetical protein